MNPVRNPNQHPDEVEEIFDKLIDENGFFIHRGDDNNRTLRSDEILLMKDELLYEIGTENRKIGRIYTLYGSKIDELLSYFLEPWVRGVDLYTSALKFQDIYKLLFNRIKEENFFFNRVVYISESHIISEALEKIREMGREEFIASLKERPERYYKSELDCIVFFCVSTGNRDDIYKKLAGRESSAILIESKLFTEPIEAGHKYDSLRNELSGDKIGRYLKERGLDFYVLTTISYFYHPEQSEYLPLPKIYMNKYKVPGYWVINIVFLYPDTYNVLQSAPYRNKVLRLAESILNVIYSNHDKLLDYLKTVYNIPEFIKLRITYNIIKVVMMYQYIEDLKRKWKSAEEKLKKAEKEKIEIKKEDIKNAIRIRFGNDSLAICSPFIDKINNLTVLDEIFKLVLTSEDFTEIQSKLREFV